MSTDWSDDFPALRALDDPGAREVLAAAKAVVLPAGATVFREGDACSHYVLVRTGRVRVQKNSESGREIVLYRICPGQGCVLTTSCLLAHSRYPAEAITESEVRGVMIPYPAFVRGLERSPGFRHFVFASFGERLADLILLVQEVAFGRMDARVARRLLERRGADGAVSGTHQELAVDLGTAREVVSRQLKDFERRGWVRLARGHIDVIDPRALEGLVGQHPV